MIATFAAVLALSASAQTVVRPSVAPVFAVPVIPMPAMPFDGTPIELIPRLSSMPLPPIPFPTVAAPAIAAAPNLEFARAPEWFDTGKLRIIVAIKADGGGTIVMRYGWRTQYEMTVFAFPDSPSVAFTEYSTDPMGKPSRVYEATMNTPEARRAASKIIRDANARHPVEDKYKEVFEAALAYLEGRPS